MVILLPSREQQKKSTPFKKEKSSSMCVSMCSYVYNFGWVKWRTRDRLSKKGNNAVLFYSRKLKEYLLVKIKVLWPCKKIQMLLI